MFVTLDTVHNKGIKVKLYSHCFVIVNFFGIDKVPIFFSKVQNFILKASNVNSRQCNVFTI